LLAVQAAKTANYTLAASDNGAGIPLNSASARTLTIAPSLPAGMQVVLRSTNSGGWTIARGSGVSLFINGSTADANGTLANGGQVTLTHWGSNVWTAAGTGIS
jgi:hypothetical protein